MDNAINGLKLPPMLVAAIGNGTWDAANKNWEAVFPPSELHGPMLYGLRLMRLTNTKWLHETDPHFVGISRGDAVPGILDTALSLLIGEVAGDAGIALDYRENNQNPSVAFLDVKFQWIEIAENFDDFWRRLAPIS